MPTWNLEQGEEILVAKIKDAITFKISNDDDDDSNIFHTRMHLELSNGCDCVKTRSTRELMEILDIKEINDIVDKYLFVRNKGNMLQRDICNIAYPRVGKCD